MFRDSVLKSSGFIDFSTYCLKQSYLVITVDQFR